MYSRIYGHVMCFYVSELEEGEAAYLASVYNFVKSRNVLDLIRISGEVLVSCIFNILVIIEGWSYSMSLISSMTFSSNGICLRRVSEIESSSNMRNSI